MKKRIISLMLILVMAIGFMPTVTYAANTTEFAGGSGTASDPYLISNKTHLNNVRNYLNAHFKLMCDIEFADADFAEGGAFYNDAQGFAPIGSRSTAFTGTFDGNGFAVKNLYINLTSSNTVYAGLFGYNNGNIKNLGMVDANVSASSDDNAYVGGIAGYTGGVVGYSSKGTITNCCNTGYLSAISSDDMAYAGGIVGYCYGTITNCYNTGNVLGTSSNDSVYTGGIAGWNSNTITNSYNTGNISIIANYYYSCIGGIVGYNSETITNCYNTGNVTGKTTHIFNSGYAGGIAGRNYDGTILDCYNIGIVLGNKIGGISGENDDGSISNCYYADITSKGVGYGTDTAAKCTLEQLKEQTTFVGFDFNTIWSFDDTLIYHITPVFKNTKHIEKNFIENTSEFAAGNGTLYSPYLISNKFHLNNVRNYPNSHFKLMCDIEFTEDDFNNNGKFYNGGKGFIPIGDENQPFAGSFNGNGFAIKNLYINISSSSESAHVGLFGYNTGAVKNLGIVDGKISAASDFYAYAGGIAGYNYNGIITNCYSTSNVESKILSQYSEYVPFSGGIAGYNYYGTITSCYNTGNVSATISTIYIDSVFSGGITGYNSYGTVTNCFNAGAVSASSTDSVEVGGIVGSNSDYSIIKNCYNSGKVSETSPYHADAGGITGGGNSGTIINCYYLNTITKGAGYGIDTAIKCTTDELENHSTFAGFDFENVWTMAGNKCYPYPELKDVKFTSYHIYDNACDTSCNVCGVTRTIVHKFGEYVYDNNATETADGTKTRTCSVCGHKETITAEGTKLEKTLINSSSKFIDVPAKAWYKKFVDYSVTYGIFTGTSSNTFSPNTDMTRAQFVQVFANISGVDTSNKNVNSGFSDVPKGKWYTAAVTWAAQNGIVNGVGGGRFDPNAKVTREQMCLMIVNYIENYQKRTLSVTTNASTFADDAKIAKWAKTAVYKCAKAGLVNGVGNNKFDPKASATRAQGATIFTNFFKEYMK